LISEGLTAISRPRHTAGWYKALVLWLFTLLTAVGFRNLVSQVVFGGLLPGEEYIDHEALQTVFIRLIPYWFNNWEQQWGVECSSLLFELPHFAIELLVILPMVQVRLLHSTSSVHVVE
jgi:hypothetical protein